jgi:hypothetical protein
MKVKINIPKAPYIDIFYDRSIKLWTALLLDIEGNQQGDAIYEGNLQSIQHDALQKWGPLRMYKDTVSSKFSKPL